MSRDYYTVLGVSADATIEQIKAAYRRKVKTLHPDRFGKNREPFLALQEAYAVLADRDKRQKYDKARSGARSGSITDSGGSKDKRINVEPLIQKKRASFADDVSPIMPRTDLTFNSDRRSAGSFLSGDRIYRDRPSGRRLALDVFLTRNEIRDGGNLQFRIPYEIACPVCSGRGFRGFFGCLNCLSSGYITREVPVSLSFPPNISDFYTVEIPLDNIGMTGSYLKVYFKHDPYTR